jgi:hypothetical protein
MSHHVSPSRIWQALWLGYSAALLTFIQYTLRESFFAFHNMSVSPEELDHDTAAKMLKHGRHCIEYIRQTLICNPDLTLEPVEGETGHLKIWGIQRQCHNFDELSGWAQDMRASDNEGITK